MPLAAAAGWVFARSLRGDLQQLGGFRGFGGLLVHGVIAWRVGGLLRLGGLLQRGVLSLLVSALSAASCEADNACVRGGESESCGCNALGLHGEISA